MGKDKTILCRELGFIISMGSEPSKIRHFKERELFRGAQETLDRLTEKGLVELDRPYPSGSKIYRLTPKGNDYFEQVMDFYMGLF